VEDNPADVLLITAAFKKERIQCHLNAVGDGEEALNYLNRKGKYAEVKTPDIILLDLNLPRMDGRTFLRRVKSEGLFKSIPVIVLTNSQSDYGMSVPCFLVKPSDLNGYTKTVKKIQDFWRTVVPLHPQPNSAA